MKTYEVTFIVLVEKEPVKIKAFTYNIRHDWISFEEEDEVKVASFPVHCVASIVAEKEEA